MTYDDPRTRELYYLQCLPFASLSDIELRPVIGTWYYDFNTDTDLFNVLPNPDKSDERDSDLMLNTPTSNYYSIPKFNQLLDTSGQNSITLFHCNIRSLPKKLTLLNDLLYSLNSRPDVLAITETKLNSQTIGKPSA